MDQAAQRVESAGRWLRDSDGDKILRDAEDFGRRNPLAVAAGGLAIGFALSRLLKASSRDRYEATSSTSPTGHANGRTAIPQQTSASRPGGLVPDLPPATGTGAPYDPPAGTTRPDAPAPPVPGDASGAVTPGGAQRGGFAPGGGTGA
jgi:hypothetical protein